jgi:tRNA(Ile)-lysidine synthase
MLKTIQSTIRKHGLLASGDHLLVAVSGGADSVALLHALCALRTDLDIRITVAHLDHCIRGEAARQDADFVADLAAKLEVPCIVQRRDIPRIARNRGISLEMAARDERYAFLAQTARRRKANAVATAHTADDQAETVLLKLTRGAGARGLGGIRHRVDRDGLTVVRPLLDATRAEVEKYLRRMGVAWREDLSNVDTSFLRNRIRHEVLPLLETRLNPKVRDALLRAADLLREDDDWLMGAAQGALVECRSNSKPGTLSVPSLRKQHLAARRRVLQLWLADEGIPAAALDFDAAARIESLLGRAKNGAIAPLAGGCRVVRRYDEITVEWGEDAITAPFRVAIAVPGETVLAEQGLRIVTEIQTGVSKEMPIQAGRLPARASLSLQALGRRKLVMRSWREGDRIRPLGMRGSKKVQDIFVDAKLARERRASVPLFDCAGEIVWVPGYRIARDWEIIDETKPALQIYVERI